MLGLGVAGVIFGDPVSRAIGDVLAPLTSGDSGIASLVPGADNFQEFYTVVSGYPAPPADYRLTVDGLVRPPSEPQPWPTSRRCRRQGWSIRSSALPVGWSRRPLDRGQLGHLWTWRADRRGDGLHFTSFDGVYTESLTIDQARLSDVIVAYQMLGGPVTREHGGPGAPLRGPMYGYKSIKWLSAISVVDRVEPGYWEDNGYDVNAWIGRSNGLSGPPVS